MKALRIVLTVGLLAPTILMAVASAKPPGTLYEAHFTEEGDVQGSVSASEHSSRRGLEEISSPRSKHYGECRSNEAYR